MDPTYGSTENYVNPSSVLAIAIIFPILAIFALVGRLLSRRERSIQIGIEDYLSAGSTIVLIGCSIDLIVGVAVHTLGHHSRPSSTDFEVPHITQLHKIQLSYNQMWFVGVTLVKLSFLFFYRRIFQSRSIFNIVNYSVMAFVVAWGVVFFFTNLFICGDHVDLTWAHRPPLFDPRCGNNIAMLFANALVSCFLDLTILLIPMPLIWQLRLDLKARLGVMSLFALGGLCVTASALRVALYGTEWYAVHTKNQHLSILGLEGADDFGLVSLALFWSQIELGVANVVVCLPLLKPLASNWGLFKVLKSKVSLQSLRKRFSGGGGTNNKMVEAEVDEAQAGATDDYVEGGGPSPSEKMAQQLQLQLQPQQQQQRQCARKKKIPKIKNNDNNNIYYLHSNKYGGNA